MVGFGTYLLPAAKSQCKELLVTCQPIVQYLAGELAANGVDQILFRTGRFDLDPELNIRLQFEEEIKAKYFYTCGETFADEQPLRGTFGDSIPAMNGRSRTLPKVAKLFTHHDASCVITFGEASAAKSTTTDSVTTRTTA